MLDVRLHGLHISPDLDTCTYTLARAINPETGWGLTGETWSAMDALELMRERCAYHNTPLPEANIKCPSKSVAYA